jgi:hypothetical protein
LLRAVARYVKIFTLDADRRAGGGRLGTAARHDLASTVDGVRQNTRKHSNHEGRSELSTHGVSRWTTGVGVDQQGKRNPPYSRSPASYEWRDAPSAVPPCSELSPARMTPRVSVR